MITREQYKDILLLLKENKVDDCILVADKICSILEPVVKPAEPVFLKAPGVEQERVKPKGYGFFNSHGEWTPTDRPVPGGIQE